MKHIFPVAKNLKDFKQAQNALISDYEDSGQAPHRVLLIALFSRKIGKHSVDKYDWDRMTIDPNILDGLRFFDIDTKLILDVNIPELEGFLDKVICINASFSLDYCPIRVAMANGNVFHHLPILEVDKLVANDSYIIDYTCDSYPIIINGRGEYACMKPKRVLLYALYKICNFYNL